MASVKFYTDEHIAQAIVYGLRQRGIDIISPVEAGTLGDSDESQLALAHQQNRVFITKDDDFLKLNAAGQAHAGIAYIPHGASLSRIISGLLLIHQVVEAQEMEGRVEFL